MRSAYFRPFILALSLALSVVFDGCGGSSKPDSGSIVATPLGTIQCLQQDAVRECLGLPYAEPPVGNLRWKSPVPVTSLPDGYQATAFGPRCAQLGIAGLGAPASDSEDCLYLNVYAPAQVSGLLPVMVWIHGGAWIVGAGSDTDASRLAALGKLIVVTLNYRLGPFGYLAHPGLSAEDPNHASGNYGLRDQVQALHWVHDNIRAFGGDAGNVTIFGESAGAFSVCNHIASPLSTGLFQKAIMESGPCISAIPQFPLAVAETLGVDFAVAHGCGTALSQEAVIACLRGQSVSDLLNPQAPGAFDPRWLANTDNYVLKDAFSTQLAAGAINRVPMLLGTNRNEGRFFIALTVPASSNSDLTASQILRQLLGPLNDSDLLQTVLTLTGGIGDAGTTTAFETASAAFGDLMFSCGADVTVNAFQASGAQVYQYEFDDPNAPGPSGLAQYPYMPVVDTHTSELIYVFNSDALGNSVSVLDPAQSALSLQMLHDWARFAYTGVPSEAANSPMTGRMIQYSPAPAGVSVVNRSGFEQDHNCLLLGPAITAANAAGL